MNLQEALNYIEKNGLIEPYNEYTIKRYGKKELNAGEIYTSVYSFIVKDWEDKNPFLAGVLQKECLSYEHYTNEILEAIESDKQAVLNAFFPIMENIKKQIDNFNFQDKNGYELNASTILAMVKADINGDKEAKELLEQLKQDPEMKETIKLIVENECIFNELFRGNK